MSNDDLIKVTDAEAAEWAKGLSESEQIELKRRALEKRAVDLLQPDEGEPNWGRMGDAEFLRERMKRHGF